MAGSHFGRRRRRVRRAITTLSIVALVGGLGAWFLYRVMRPEGYRPGEDHEEITTKLSLSLPEEAPDPVFADITEESGLGDFQTFAGGRTSQLPEDMGSGLAWGDFDRDGDDDLMLMSMGGPLGTDKEGWAASELYENLGNARFAKVADFPDLRIVGMGAAWGDVDGDGWLDLAVAGYRTLLLLRNHEGKFEIDESFDFPDDYWADVSWADYDRDGDLDLYVTGYVKYIEPDPGATRKSTQQYGAAVPYTLNPATYEPERNLLLRNDGSGRFEDVAEELGVDNPVGRSLSALWHDWNQDGWPDLYVANDVSDNALFLNREGHFEDVSLESWVADYRGAMGLAAGDWNRDGDDDLFVSHWVAQENALYDSLLMDTTVPGGPEPTMAFTDKAVPLGLGQIALPFVGWGSEFADFDRDGWLDLVIANGSTFETEDVPPRLEAMKMLLMWNQQGKHFHDISPLSEVLSRKGVGRGLGVSDFDLDGDLDFVVSMHGEGVRLLRNEMQGGHWLELRLLDKNGAPSLLARVKVQIGDLTLRRTVSGASFLSKSSSTLHFGLGEAAQVDAIEVRWPDGQEESFPGVTADALYELERGDDQLRARERPVQLTDRERLARFWEIQRAGMDAVKIENDAEKGAELFREALRLDPKHEDARYYLANCLAVLGEPEQAIAELETLQELQPQSHRGFKRAGMLRALIASSPAELERAEADLRRALEINTEGTGALLVLGEIELIQGRKEIADENLALASRTNPRATGAFFLRGYMAWKQGDSEAARLFLETAAGTRGEDWKPEGAVAEGDVDQKMHREMTPLAPFWEAWDGSLDPDATFAEIDAYLADWSRLSPS